MGDSELINLNEAVDYVMRVTGKSRREAKAALIEACRQGKIRVTGIDRSGERVTVPPDAFPKVN